MEYRLGSINATLVGEELEYDNGQSEWLISYLAKYDWENQAPHSTEDAFNRLDKTSSSKSKVISGSGIVISFCGDITI